jgi:hypothetical protein
MRACVCVCACARVCMYVHKSANSWKQTTFKEKFNVSQVWNNLNFSLNVVCFHEFADLCTYIHTYIHTHTQESVDACVRACGCVYIPHLKKS